MFVCVKNAGRSQMAEAFAKKHGLNAQSAGTIPSLRINPILVQVMHERCIDISNKSSKASSIRNDRTRKPRSNNGVVCRRSVPETYYCPMRKNLIEWHLDDPKGKPLEEVRRIRDEIEHKIGELSTLSVSSLDGQLQSS